MIVWLASYPRSGNTLLRQMLKRCFGVESHSVYNDLADIAKVPEVSEAVGHVSYTGDWRDFYAQASCSSAVFHIKTHDAPSDDSRAIYVVRHPHQAARSYMEYLNRIAGKKVDMIDSICGIGSPFPSWGEHLNQWSPLSRPNTLLLKYEDLIFSPESQLARVEQFLCKDRINDWENTFEDLHEVMPGFFGRGKAACIEADPAECRLIRLLYGTWMDRLGYADPVDTNQDDEWVGLLGMVAARYHSEVQELHKEINQRAEYAWECRHWAEKAENRFMEQRELAAAYLAILNKQK